MAKSVKNNAASVHRRLLNKAKESSRPFNEFLQYLFDFKGKLLAEAVEKTFEKRNTPVTFDAALFDPSFGKDRDKNVQWQGFIRKTKLINAPKSFEEVMAGIKLFLKPLAASVVEKKAFNSNWMDASSQS